MQSTAVINESSISRASGYDVYSKVLVVEHDAAKLETLKHFIENCKLVGYQASKNTIENILKSSVDLGAMFLPHTDAQGNSNAALILAIHRARSELPIFLRVASHEAVVELPDELKKAVAGFYVYGELERMKALVDKYLFNRHYPSEFVASVKEFTLSAFRAAFRNFEVAADIPYIVKDKIIYGELFSLLPLESSWCRGYMMLQCEEENIREAIAARKTQLNSSDPDFRHVNGLLGELANMIWGGFKTRYGASSIDTQGRVRVEVPIIINHARKFISFGADDPQLCLKFTLTDPDGELGPVVVYEKFIFSLDWSPDKYAEANRSVNELVSSGELEMF